MGKQSLSCSRSFLHWCASPSDAAKDLGDDLPPLDILLEAGQAGSGFRWLCVGDGERAGGTT